MYGCISDNTSYKKAKLRSCFMHVCIPSKLSSFWGKQTLALYFIIEHNNTITQMHQYHIILLTNIWY